VSPVSAGLRPRRARRQGGMDRDFGYDSINVTDRPVALNQAALDTFNAGANQDLNTRTGWSATLLGTTVSLRTDATPTYAVNPSATFASYNFWSDTGQDECAWVLYGAVIASFHWLWVRASYTSAGAPTDGYFLYSDVSGYGELWRVNAGVSTFMASGSRPSTSVTGEKAQVQAVGNRISAFYDKGAGLIEFIDTIDSSVPGIGAIGIQSQAASTTQFDAFGGGPFIAPPPRSEQIVVRRIWTGR
jgi:hypothetical protein